MAMVYLADDLRHQRKVALKVLRSELAAVVPTSGSRSRSAPRGRDAGRRPKRLVPTN